MAMKLQTPIQNRDKEQSDISKKLLRAQETERLAADANKRLAKYESDFADAMARNQAQWLIEEENHQKMVREREQELSILEKRKEEALIPIEIYKEKADKIMQTSLDFQEKVAKEKEDVDQQFDLLSQRLSDVEDREHSLAEKEERLNNREYALNLESEQTIYRTKQLTEQIAEFHAKQTKDNESIEQRKKEVTLAEISFAAKIEKYNRDREALKDFEVKLKDREATLEREIKRLSPYKTAQK